MGGDAKETRCGRCGKLKTVGTACEGCYARVKQLRSERRKAGRCPTCGGKRDRKDRVRCHRCRNRDRRIAKRNRVALRRRGLCTSCGRNPPMAGASHCRECVAAHRDARQRLKAEVFAAYGGVCACCGENGLPFLNIDHINNDGVAHRLAVFGAARSTGGTRMYQWLRKNRFPPGFQVLCFNCNAAKYQNGGVCPHTDGSLDAVSRIAKLGEST